MDHPDSSMINILLIGGCGHWSSKENHVPAILDMKRAGWPVRVSAICDYRDPYSEDVLRHMPALRELVNEDRPTWIQPRADEGSEMLAARLDSTPGMSDITAAVIACDPVHHYAYLKWATERGVHVLCDKPLICAQDAAWNMDSALQIENQFREILTLHRKRQELGPHFIALPLRRRANDVFVQAAQSISEVHDQYKQSLTLGSFLVNGGFFRFPEEYALGNAHGYGYGVGSLSFSSYHYIDLIAWYLQIARGDIARLKISNPYVRRVGDYLETQQNSALGGLLADRSEVPPRPDEIPAHAARSEMDVSFTIQLLDMYERDLGMLSYTFLANSYSHRTVGLLESDREREVGFREKGRMSQFVIDVNQGNLQHIRITKNDAVGDKYRIRLERRRNPSMNMGELQDEVFENAHANSSVTPQAVTQAFIRHAAGRSGTDEALRRISFIEDQVLTHTMFEKFYQLVAANWERRYSGSDTSPEPSTFVELS
ncbi:Gfo/Idh/MocA family oxidoreductase [Streptomyces avidinii]|uniref:Gfo/Idh/MocA family oxidoreductase n=1 Tax=Streptomyces avidinii TaxID=1895 RepID=UPI0037979AD5